MQYSKVPGNETGHSSCLGSSLWGESYRNDYLLYPWVKLALNPTSFYSQLNGSPWNHGEVLELAPNFYPELEQDLL